MRILTALIVSALLHSPAMNARSAPSLAPASVAAQDAFFGSLSKLCGKAFEGRVTVDNPESDGFGGRLVMHVRECTDSQLRIPFHVGDDRSRTWIISRTGSGLQLKHDHRHKDGSSDRSTLYGGHTADAGWAQVQSFPADPYSKELFVAAGNPQSIGNTWQIYVYPEKFTYRLVREGREFRVDFDLSRPVEPPPAPWGYAE
jgi:hypothetical protein